MAEVIKMPKMSDTMTEGVIASWHKKVGDQVKAGEVLAEVETDKATMELESYETGTLLYIGVQEKEAVPVDAVIAVIGKAGENIDALISGASGGSQQVSEAPAPAAKAPSPAAAPAPVNATAIRMPKMSDTMTDGTLVAWHKQVGDKVKAGDLLAEIETDKATMELESYESGTLLYTGIKAGESARVDDVIAIIGEAGTDFSSLLHSNPVAAEKPAETAQAPAAPQATAVQAAAPKADASGRIIASPLARQLAREKGIDLSSVSGSGENGRIVKRDVESAGPQNFVSAQPASAPAAKANAGMQESWEDVPLSQMRKTIARRLSESLYTAPHFYLTMEINMDKAIEARKSIKEILLPVY